MAALPSYFVKAIRANSADDGLRLQVADWFDENGQSARAEFVRVQVAAGRCRNCEGVGYLRGLGLAPPPAQASDRACMECGVLRGRARELLDALVPGDLCRNETAWAGPAASLVRPTSPTPYQFRRGFLEFVICPAADWLAHGDAIYVREPVAEVTLTDRPRIEREDRHEYRSDLKAHVYRRTCRVGGRLVECQEHISVREAALARDGVALTHEVRYRIDRKTTDELVLACIWPGVTFTLTRPAGTVIRGRPQFTDGPMSRQPG